MGDILAQIIEAAMEDKTWVVIPFGRYDVDLFAIEHIFFSLGFSCFASSVDNEIDIDIPS